MKKILISVLSLTIAIAATTAFAGWDVDEADEYHEKAQVALGEFKEKDPKVQKFIDQSIGESRIFPFIECRGIVQFFPGDRIDAVFH